MNGNICRKAILKTAGIAVFAVMFYVGCYDLGIEPSVKPPVITTFVDIRDGKTYKKEQIGDQIWMAENLNYAADGSVCYGEGSSSIPDPLNVSGLVPYGDGYAWATRLLTRSEICDIYGRLYDWNTAMNNESSSNAIPSGVEGVCPMGWHLPSNAEWKKLTDYVGEHAGTKLKSHGFPRGQYEPEGTDLYNFSALPGGYGSYLFGGVHTDEIHYFGLGSLSGVYSQGHWWTSTETPSHSEKVYSRWMGDDRFDGDKVMELTSDKHTYFYSVRCVHD